MGAKPGTHDESHHQIQWHNGCRFRWVGMLSGKSFQRLHTEVAGADYEVVGAPRVADFADIGYNPITLVFDRDNPQVVYGSTGPVWALGIVKSEDGMKTWEKSDNGIASSSRTMWYPIQQTRTP